MLDEKERRAREQAEVRSLLASGLFARSPNLASFLQYVCDRHFAGEASKIKEYNVAVEALGRGSDFDQKRDSIVRVEAHRLRKRLQDYYDELGTSHPVEITIPSGSYAPQFTHRAPAISGVESLPAAPAAPIPVAPAIQFLSLRSALVMAVLLISVLVAALSWSRSQSQAAVRLAATPKAGVDPADDIRILCGSDTARFVDHLGNVWGRDRFFRGGDTAVDSTRSISRTSDDALYQSRREGEFSYDIPLSPGSYELRLHFAETVFGESNIAGGGEASRIFHIKANGEQILGDLDVIADAPGSNVADVRVFRNIKPASDGALHLQFVPTVKEKPFVNAIEIVPAVVEGRLNPVRVLAGSVAFAGGTWGPDRYFEGGQQVKRHEAIAGTAQQEQYKSERFGHFSYVIPVASGSRYTVTLKFVESWFGPGRTGGGEAGSRLFDVYCNGRTLLKNFDALREAGAPLRAVDKVFRGLEPSAQGKLVFQFVPRRNYAFLNAIEVMDEGADQVSPGSARLP